MKKNNLWIIPCCFLAVAAIVNFIGCGIDRTLASMVKPALLPLLTATTLAWLTCRTFDSRKAGLLVAAQLLGCAGDIFLISDTFIPFACGMGSFLAGHVCYMCLFGGDSWKGLGWKTWVPSLIVMAALVAGLVAAIGIKGALLGPMAVYGMGLMMLIFSGAAGLVRFGGKTWWLILCGALLFTFSDSLIAMGSFDVLPFKGRGVVIMVTYIAAQSLLAAGGIRLATQEK